MAQNSRIERNPVCSHLNLKPTSDKSQRSFPPRPDVYTLYFDLILCISDYEQYQTFSFRVTPIKTLDNAEWGSQHTRDPCRNSMNNKTQPPHELLLAQLILSAFILGLVGHASYEKHISTPRYVFKFENGKPVFRFGGLKHIPINEFHLAHAILFLLSVSAAYFFNNLLLYVTNKVMREPLLNATVLILLQDVVFCFLMFTCGAVAMAHIGYNATGYQEIEILIASGVSMFCGISSGVGVYYSYRVYKGL